MRFGDVFSIRVWRANEALDYSHSRLLPFKGINSVPIWPTTDDPLKYRIHYTFVFLQPPPPLLLLAAAGGISGEEVRVGLLPTTSSL